jgi:4'-phosphopantetheinyl transferase
MLEMMPFVDRPKFGWPPAVTHRILSPRDLHIWIIRLDQPLAFTRQLSGYLSADEQGRANRFVFPRDRRRFCVARGMLRSLLGFYLGMPPTRVQFKYGAQGKPALAPAPAERLRFNLSHSHERAVYAFAYDREVGVDLEYLRWVDDLEQIAERNFSPWEGMALRALPASEKQAAFFYCWTRKEAYLKALGDGLARPLDQFDVSLAPGEPARLLRVVGQPQETTRWSLSNLELGADYAGAVAVEGDDCQLSYWEWDKHWLKAIEAL